MTRFTALLENIPLDKKILKQVVGLNEATLAPFYFIDTAKNGATVGGEAMKLIDRDT